MLCSISMLLRNSLYFFFSWDEMAKTLERDKLLGIHD